MTHVLGTIAIAVLGGLGYLLFLALIVFGGWGAYVLSWRVGLIKDPRRRPGDLTEAARLRARMTRSARPTLLLTPAKESGFSKLGGEPELPAGVDWPPGERSPRTFLAQLDLAQVRAAGGPEWLPAEGRLYAFHDEWRNGFPDNLTMVFDPDARSSARIAPPAVKTFAERRVGFLTMTSVPSLDWLGVDVAESDLSDEQLDALADAPNAPFGDELQHRIGGYPAEIQDGQMQVECEYLARGLQRNYREPVPEAINRASKQWRLLLQIDSDPALGMNWGDGGRLYVFIREKHARAGDFSKTVSLSQTY